jgi:hypothetical protein
VLDDTIRAFMSDLARRNNFRWDAIRSADIARDYLAAAEAISLKPHDCTMWRLTAAI